MKRRLVSYSLDLKDIAQIKKKAIDLTEKCDRHITQTAIVEALVRKFMSKIRAKDLL